MKMVKKIIGFFLFLIFFLPLNAGAYDDYLVHPKLTEVAISVYNQNSLENEIYNWQAEAMIIGVSAEDGGIRFLHHFYNPETKQGLYGKFSSAKEWAWVQPDDAENYSVPNILQDYRQGNFQRAYEGVGHILHLVQDMAVPAHTRDDDHKSGNFFQDSYEAWVKYNVNIDISKINFFAVDNLNSVFDRLAQYSHNNFFSANTISNETEKIIKTEKTESGKKYAICSDSDGIEFYCLHKDETSFNSSYDLDDPLVHKAYWDLLYPKAVGYSAGVIEYFQKEFTKIDRAEGRFAPNDSLSIKPQKILSSNGAKSILDSSHYKSLNILDVSPVQAEEDKNSTNEDKTIIAPEDPSGYWWEKIKEKSKIFLLFARDLFSIFKN